MTTMHDVHDGIINGLILERRAECSNCSMKTTCIWINEIVLPAGIEPFPRLIFYKTHPLDIKEIVPIWQVGIGCGCYGKGHRQIAHISAALKARDKTTT